MKQITVKEFKEIQNRQHYKYMALFDQSGGAIIPFNSNRVTSADRMREIETRLLNDGLKDGFYIVKCKNTTVKTVQSDDYLILKGKAAPLSEVAPIQIVESIAPNLLTYESALKLNIEVESLKLENNALKKEIAQLKEELAEAENENFSLSENPENSTMDNAKDFLTNAMGFIAPLLDKHYELKEKALGLRAIELELKMGSMKKPSPEQKPQPTQQQIIEAFIMQQKDQPEIYEELAALYNSAQNVEDFLKGLKEYNEDLFNTLINGK
jgi:hypothetical protein